MGLPLYVEERIDERRSGGGLRGDGGEANGASMAGVGVGGVAGLRANDLLKDQHVASLKIGEGSGERGFGRALRQAAVGVAPRVDLHGILLGEKLGVLHGLEGHDAGVERGLFVARASTSSEEGMPGALV